MMKPISPSHSFLHGISPLRQIGRWGLRLRLQMMRDWISSSKAKYNGRLNDKELWHGRLRLHSFPRYVQVGTNWTCDLKCGFCRRQLDDHDRMKALKPEERELPEAALRQLLRIMPYAESFSLTPLGEPLLYSGLERILEHHRRVGCANLHLTTNGNGLTDEWARRLTACETRRLYVSVDSPDPETYAAMRQGGDLDKVTKGLMAVARHKQSLSTPWPEVVILGTFQRSNIESLPSLIKYGHKVGAARVAVQLMEIYDASQVEESLTTEPALLKRFVDEGRAVAGQCSVDLWLATTTRNLMAAKDRKEKQTKGSFDFQAQCAFPWSSLMVDTNGEARPCCWASYSYGNLAVQSFESLWNGNEAQFLRRSFLEGKLPSSCRSAHCRVDF